MKEGQSFLGPARFHHHRSMLLSTMLGAAILASEGAVADGWMLDLNAYPVLTDTRSDNYLTINAAAKFGENLTYFSLSNFGEQKRADRDGYKNTFYTEQNLRWRLGKSLPLDLTLQMNFRSGEQNDRHRLGVRWRLHDTAAFVDFFKALNLTYSLNFHMVQFDHEDAYVWQIEHAFAMKFPGLSERLYLAGFIDHTFNQDLPDNYPASPIVAEIQTGFRLVDRLYAIAEYRINDYRRADTDNLALGLQYKITW